MPILASCLYDPGTAVTNKACTAAAAMTALDTTNLRCSFTAPASGNVYAHISVTVSGGASSTAPVIHLGVLDGATLKGRMVVLGAQRGSALATTHQGCEVAFPITGLTPGNNYNYDAAWAVEAAVASANIMFGGPDNATAADAWGGVCFEIWDAGNMLAGTLYDPTTAVTKGTTASALAAFDTTNLRLTFTAPTSGKVYWRVAAPVVGTTTYTQILLGVLDGATIKGRVAPVGMLIPQSAGANQPAMCDARGVITGLTGGNSYTYDAAWGIETFVASSLIKYGGPNDATLNNAWGGVAFESWKA